MVKYRYSEETIKKRKRAAKKFSAQMKSLFIPRESRYVTWRGIQGEKNW